MKFGKTLKNSIYQPWNGNYIDYGKLKALLREDEAGDGDTIPWTDEDDGRFVEELINVQLEKVNAFHVDTIRTLRDRTAACESKLETSRSSTEGKSDNEESDGSQKQSTQQVQHEILKELDGISREMNELEKYSRVNYTGFLKAVKKHDRRRGSNYKVRPLLQVRLAALPFNSEDYSPLLYRYSLHCFPRSMRLSLIAERLSAMYSFVQQHLDHDGDRTVSFSESKNGGATYTTNKCELLFVLGKCFELKSLPVFVHPENLLEVKTYILRRLPVLVYNPKTAKVVEGSQSDPTINSLYFDNSNFSLYTRKIEKVAGASSLRLRWFGQLAEKPEILLEKKTLGENNSSQEVRFSVKDKYVTSFIKGEYKMDKSLQKLRDRKGENSEEIWEFEKNVDEIQQFIQEHELQPMLRANYTRTAFQIPGDNRVRISIDTNLALIREDCLDADRPCRDPQQWHRSDIDDAQLEFPFASIKKGEVSRFPYAILEIKVKDGASKSTSEWIGDLMSSHLVREAPRFSKFAHGIASLFESNVNILPFWISSLETDIRKDPGVAFKEEQEKKAKQVEDEVAVGSFIGAKSIFSFKAAIGSPVGKTSAFLSATNDYDTDGIDDKPLKVPDHDDTVAEAHTSENDGELGNRAGGVAGGLRSLFPSFSTSKYARARRQSHVTLPPGVRHPGQLIKDMGPVRVEPKVWLANQRFVVHRSVYES